MSQKVSIIDYGVGNLLNVVRGFEHCDAIVEVVESSSQIKNSDYLVLPGVGAFPDGMYELEQRGLIDSIVEHAQSGKPLLGICLGMQMLLDSSEEFGGESGLGLVSGKVIAIPDCDVNGDTHKIPHIGWNELLSPEEKSWSGTVLQDIKKESAVYFVHSFMASPNSNDALLSYCDYDGCHIAAVIQSENVIGCQFHPEKSGDIGLKIIRNFMVL
jgi:glutamine amidotransferase